MRLVGVHAPLGLTSFCFDDQLQLGGRVLHPYVGPFGPTKESNESIIPVHGIDLEENNRISFLIAGGFHVTFPA